MIGSLFRVKPYSHPKYKFVVRAKIHGKWKRSYFSNEADALAYAQEQNRAAATPARPAVGPSQRNHSKSEKRPAAAPKPVSRTVVVVLGLHRSGASALQRALSHLGIDFGRRPASPGTVKPEGSHADIAACHDELFGALGWTWDDERPLPDDWVNTEAARKTRSCLIDILERDFGHTKFFGLKDPGLARLLPLWFSIFESLRLEPRFVLTMGHPLAVAESLAQRNSFPPAKSYRLWLNQVIESETSTRGKRRAFVCYDNLLADPEGTLNDVRSGLGLAMRAPSRAKPPLRKVLKPFLRHDPQTQITPSADGGPDAALAIKLYDTLSASGDSTGLGERIQTLIEEFARKRELSDPTVDFLRNGAGRRNGSHAEKIIQSVESLDAFYGDDDPWGYHSNTEDAKRRSVLLSEIPKRDYKATLDLGCGNGFVTAHLPGEKVLGVDISKRAIEHARTQANERCSFAVADLFELSPKKIGTFDLVVITGVLYPQYIGHAGIASQLVIDRLLAPGGVLVSVHIEAWYQTRFPYLLAKQITYPYREYTHLLEIYFK